MEKVAKVHGFILRRSMRRDKWYLFTLLLLSTCLRLDGSVDAPCTSELSPGFLKTLAVRCRVGESATEHLKKTDEHTCGYFLCCLVSRQTDDNKKTRIYSQLKMEFHHLLLVFDQRRRVLQHPGPSETTAFISDTLWRRLLTRVWCLSVGSPRPGSVLFRRPEPARTCSAWLRNT